MYKSVFFREFVEGQILQTRKFGKMQQIFVQRKLTGQKEVDSGKFAI